MKLIIIGLLGIILLNGCDSTQKEAPTKEVLEVVPPTPPKPNNL